MSEVEKIKLEKYLENENSTDKTSLKKKKDSKKEGSTSTSLSLDEDIATDRKSQPRKSDVKGSNI